MYDIRFVTDTDAWDNFVRKQLYTLFVQSSTYGEIMRQEGESYWIIGVYSSADELIGGSLVISTHAKRGNFLFLPYGPLLDFSKQDLVKKFVEFLKIFGKKEGYDFIRMSPFVQESITLNTFVLELGFRQAPMHMLAETTWLLHLTDKEDVLLQNMNKNHRNLIRRCEKEGVRITQNTNSAGIAIFNDMHDETTARHKFHRFPRSYVANEVTLFAQKDETVLFEGTLPNGTIDAAAVVIYFGNMAAYHHGASRGSNKKIPTSYLLQWEAIKEAKRRGMEWYNFWGIAPDVALKTHPFYGITHFKKGFGGTQLSLVHCLDLPLTATYWFTWTIETLRRIKRGF